jgi:hypothetical protein
VQWGGGPECTYLPLESESIKSALLPLNYKNSKTFKRHKKLKASEIQEFRENKNYEHSKVLEI